MRLDPSVCKNWKEIQAKYDYPVNAIGVRISSRDFAALKTWIEEGIDKFMKKQTVPR